MAVTPVDRARTGATPGRRELILRLLREAESPLSIADLAAELGVHPNTIRFHLDTLVRSGRAERVLGSTQGPGRPPARYRAQHGMDRDGPTNYRFLATVLTEHLAGTARDPARAAAALGRRWGPTLVSRHRLPVPRSTRAAQRGRISRSAAVSRIVGVLAELGFEPEPPPGARASEIRVRHCPFLELVDEHAHVICSLHLGLMQGGLAALDAPVTVDRLDPFVRPDLCVARLAGATGKRAERAQALPL